MVLMELVEVEVADKAVLVMVVTVLLLFAILHSN
tara:strand:- start:37 stop:138 length:102 start_codon:yes stop_codon:yes gene_type:complete